VRRIFLAISAILLTACGTATQTSFVFPEAAGVWKLKAKRDLSATDAPESVRRLGLKRVQSGEYEGPGRISAQVYEMTSSSGAFESEQTWKAAANTVAFHKEQYFTVIHWEDSERTSVSAFVREMEKELGR